MKHTLIIAHPREKSFTKSMAEAYAAAAGSEGHEVLIRDLYAMGFDPCLHEDELVDPAGFAPRADVVAERKLLGGTGVYALFYPFWFNAPPAILKGYIDRVFCAGFGFRPGHAGSEPLLRGSKLISFTSSGAPEEWVETTGAMPALRKLFDEHVAAMCGLEIAGHLHFGRITLGIREDFVRLCAARVAKSVPAEN